MYGKIFDINKISEKYGSIDNLATTICSVLRLMKI